MANSDLSYVVVGGLQPRITTRSRLPLFQRGFIFPFVIACETALEAQYLHPALTNILVSLGSPDAHNDPANFAHNIFTSLEIDTLEIHSHTKWYPLFREEIPQIRAIYMRHSDLSDALNDTTYSKFRRYASLKRSLLFMVLRGDEQEMRRFGFLGNEGPGISHRASPVKAPRPAAAAPPHRPAPDRPVSAQPRAPRIPTSTPLRAPRISIYAHPHPTPHPEGKRDDEGPINWHSSTLEKYPDRHGFRSSAQAVIESSLAGSSRPIANNDKQEIWSYMRDLQGIVGVLYQPVPTPQKSTLLGVLADDYLHAHGYTSSAIESVTSIAYSSSSLEGFRDTLAALGFARTEAEFLWNIIEQEDSS